MTWLLKVFDPGAWFLHAYGLVGLFFLHTGRITADPAVHRVWAATVAAAAGSSALLFCVGALRVGAGAELFGGLALRDLLVRWGLSVVGIMGSLRLVQAVITFNDRLIEAFARAVSLPSFPPLLNGGILAILLLWLPTAVLAMVWLVTYLVRLMELYALAAAAPLAMASITLPETTVFFRSWFWELIAVTFTQAAQALVLLLMQSVALPGGDAFPESAFFTLALLYVMVRIPAWMRQLGARSAPASPWVAALVAARGVL